MFKKMLQVVGLVAVMSMGCAHEAKAWCFVPPPCHEVVVPAGQAAGGSSAGWGAFVGGAFTALAVGDLIFFAEDEIRWEGLKHGVEALGGKTWSSQAHGDFPKDRNGV